MIRIRELRAEKNWNQQDLAELLATTRQSVARYETGERNVDVATILRLCEIFGCTADYLLGRSARRTAEVAEEDLSLLAALHAAPASVREAIGVLLAPYAAPKKEETAS